MADDLAQWLERLGLGKYAEILAEHEVSVRDLPHLTEDDLKDLGLPLGPRRRLLAAVKSGNEFSASTQPEQRIEEEVAPPLQKATVRSAERRLLTVMFADLVGSTELSRRLDPEDLRELLRRYQDAVAAVVRRYDGHIAKFLGDGVLAYFGWPQAHEDDGERAVRTGLETVAAVADIECDKGEYLRTRVGIATGQVVVGDLVSGGHLDAEAVTGETPNLAARLQGAAEPGTVLIDTATRSLVGDVFELRQFADQVLKGFAEPVPVWRVLAERAVASRFEAAHGAGLTALVGREHEIGLLLDRWRLSSAGEGQVVLLSGPAGIGKSRMLGALSECVADTEHFRLRYQCSPYHSNIAFYPAIRQLELAADFISSDGIADKLDKLERLLELVRAGRRCGGATVRHTAVLASRGSLRSPQPVIAAATRADHCHFDRTIGGARPATAGTFPGGGCALDRPIDGSANQRGDRSDNGRCSVDPDHASPGIHIPVVWPVAPDLPVAQPFLAGTVGPGGAYHRWRPI